MAKFIEWGSRMALEMADGTRYYVEKYVRRKSAALVKLTGNVSQPVAYFTSHEEAEEFCRRLLGGVREVKD